MRKIRNILIFLTVLTVTFGSGYNLGKKEKVIIPVKSQSIGENDKSLEKNLDLSLFWEVWDRLYYYYLDKASLDSQKMIYGAISGMVSSLGDPYTVFLSPDQNKEAKDDLGGKFEGIGAQLGVKDKKIVVIAPLPKSPAEAAGLRPEDWILKVNGKETLNWTLPETVSKIRGPKGSKVLLTVLHKDEEKSLDVEVKREEIKVASVEWKKINVECRRNTKQTENLCVKKEEICSNCKAAFYLKLSRFGDTTNNEWLKAVDEIEKEIAQTPKDNNLGIILDLRNNPGGYLSGSVFIASEFIKEGTVVTQANSDNTKKTYTVSRQGKLTNVPMVVLINKGSASAAEIVAGALQIRKKIKLVGETSFGKGTIQEAQDLKEGAGIHITTAKWLLPDNSNINSAGIKPTVLIENDESNLEEDKQLDKAIDTLFSQFSG